MQQIKCNVMTGFIKQYRKEIRNIFLLALLVAALPYLPAVAAFLATFTGLMVCMGLLGGVVLGMTLKVYYRILVLRIAKDNQPE